MKVQLRNPAGIILLALFVASCATHTVKSTTYTPVVQASQNVPENLLLDVGVSVFDPGIDEIKNGERQYIND